MAQSVQPVDELVEDRLREAKKFISLPVAFPSRSR